MMRHWGAGEYETPAAFRARHEAGMIKALLGGKVGG
jgi:hypothetical protein